MESQIEIHPDEIIRKLELLNEIWDKKIRILEIEDLNKTSNHNQLNSQAQIEPL